MLGIILLGLAIAAVLLLLNQGRNQAERLAQLEAQNLQLHERVQILEALVLEKEKRRPFAALESPDSES
ncbi:hypothetical protein [Oceanisphaera sp. W20_SRM_FM3]|uniref:hypothetical protein n=1 Tax=Oceanisphaera sp. W20_SRM_FM3 TaxID=3240267 RepID=UPI003F99944F